MNDYIIMTDSCVDLTHKMAEKMELKVIPLAVNIQGKAYYNYLDEREITSRRFYNLLKEHILTSTSQVNPNEFIEFMKPFLDAGKDILYIGFSSALSGTYNSAVQALDELNPLYPDRKIITVDSLCASMGEGLLVTYAAELKKSGKTIDEVAAWVEQNKTKLCHLFTVGDLNHLRRGGRLSYSKALLGTLLKVKPLLHVNVEGKLVQTGKTRGRQSSLRMLVDRMVETIVNPKEQTIFISHGDCYEEAMEVKKMIEESLPVKEIIINFIGPVIGSHSGLGTLAIFYLGEDRFKPYE